MSIEIIKFIMEGKKNKIKDEYGKIAKDGGGCGCEVDCYGDDTEEISKNVGYSDERRQEVSEVQYNGFPVEDITLKIIKKGDTKELQINTRIKAIIA